MYLSVKEDIDRDSGPGTWTKNDKCETREPREPCESCSLQKTSENSALFFLLPNLNGMELDRIHCSCQRNMASFERYWTLVEEITPE